ncbi:hypothetical protein [Streptomyces sp. NPDC057363]|uniref:hypothetical protein n=1 Tax=Streptomyces sp. NPDC057363 TaxID=3346107 RepID=UPI003639D506
MYDVKVPNGLMEFFSETGAFQGGDKAERPVVGEELKSLKWGPKGAVGQVSFYTLGWMVDQAENGYLGRADLKSSARKAGQAAAERYATAYEEGKKDQPEEEPVTVDGVTIDGVVIPSAYGLPVYHVRDKDRIVGFMTDKAFKSVENAKADNSGKGGKS